MTLNVLSRDGQTFSLPISEVQKFGTIRSMLEGLGKQNTNFNEIIPLPNVDARTLQILKDCSMSDSFDVAHESIFDVMLAANYLDFPELLSYCGRKIAASIRDKKAADVRKMFSLKSHLNEEETRAVTIDERDYPDSAEQSSALETFPFCQSCGCKDSSILKTCSRCFIVKYCSVDCQKRDLAIHKVLCKELKDVATEIDRLGRDSGSRRSDLQLKKLEIFLELSRQSRNRKLVESGLEECFSLLRINKKKRHQICFRLPFALIHLGRDDDAFSFIKWWIMSDQNEIASNFESDDQRFEYFVEHDISEDLLPFTSQNPFFEVHFVTALAIVKARLIDKCKKRRGELDLFKRLLERESHPIIYARPVIECVAKNVLLCDDVTLNQQEQLFENYVDIIFQKNPTFLQALVNPDPLTRIRRSHFVVDGSPTEAKILWADSRFFFTENPMALKSVIRRVGKNPTYKVNTDPIRVM